jgi:hypothetical protein
MPNKIMLKFKKEDYSKINKKTQQNHNSPKKEVYSANN